MHFALLVAILAGSRMRSGRDDRFLWRMPWMSFIYANNELTAILEKRKSIFIILELCNCKAGPAGE
jgi:hypothetical protein